jgi:tetratricopeptide (TPR) repeat protein
MPNPRVDRQDAFSERVKDILEELLLGLQWQRPSLIMAIYRSQHTRNRVQNDLAGALGENGTRVLAYQVDTGHYDIPRELLEHPGRASSVYFIQDIRRGGGRGYSNACRALNMHREYLVEGGIKAVFWLNEMEHRQVCRHAPDFWAFRHRVVEFPELPARRAALSNSPGRYRTRSAEAQTLLAEADRHAALGCFHEALPLLQKALRLDPHEIAARLRLAQVQIALGGIPAARRALKRMGSKPMPEAWMKGEYDRLVQAAGAARPGGILEREE